MLLLFIALAIGINYNHDKIEFLDSYSIFVENPSINYKLATKDENGNDLNELNYKPVISSFNGMSFTVEDITVSLSIQAKDKKLEEFKESRLFDLQFYGVYKKLMWELYYQNYQGLYIDDDDQISTDNLPTANSYSYGANIRFFTKDEFKPKKSFSSFTDKKVSQWSWVYGFFVNRSQLLAEDGLVPFEYRENFDQIYGLTEFNTFSLGLDGGIAGLTEWRGLYLSYMFTFGTQMQQQQFTGIGQKDRIVSGGAFNGFLDFGYDTKLGSFGALVRTSLITHPIKNAEYQLSRGNAQIYYKRFF